MKAHLVAKLRAINRDFYSRFATEFSSTRSGPWPGFYRLLERIPDDCLVLDLGCGNGRFADFLAEHRRRVVYTGLDGSPQLVAMARDRAAALVGMKTDFRVVDLTDPDWTEPVRETRFSIVLALAVLQHVPSLVLRTQLISQAATLLSPGGAMLMSSWQFTSSERMRRKIVPWSHVGIDQAELEPGDYLLDWKHGEAGYRYCHLLGTGEIAALATAAGLDVVETFRADGREGNLNLYAVLSA